MRLAVLLTAGIGALGMVEATAGAAHATVPLTGVAGGFSTQTDCDASQAASSGTPGAVVAQCSYYPAADPSVHIPGPGWYYRYALPGDAACGIGCHTPSPAPPFYGPVIPGCPSRLSCDPH
jgi:hypothetical protein